MFFSDVVVARKEGDNNVSTHYFEERGINDKTWIAVVNPLHIPFILASGKKKSMTRHTLVSYAQGKT